VAFTPASSIASAAGGVVAVSNFPAIQPVSGTVAVSGVAGTVLVDGSAVVQPVSGPLTDAELRASAVAIDGSAVTQPVSADSLPLPDGAATDDYQARELAALNDVALTAILERDKLAV
jgi:hypothetical protein